MQALPINRESTLLRIRMLGRLELFGGDETPLPMPTTLKARALLTYLVLHRDLPQAREQLAGLFWGDCPEQKARRSLSTALWHIRRALPNEDIILGDYETIQFDPRANLQLDIDDFEALIATSDTPSLQTAVGLYRGPFLDGFYDDWVINERYRLEALYFDALARLMTAYEARRESEAALTTALRLLNHDSLREDAHRVAMRAYCHLGRRNAALEQYRRCQACVQTELGIEPMAETTALYQDILEGRFTIGPALPTLRLQMPVATIAEASSHYDPLDAGLGSPLVGRDRELAYLHACWKETEARQGRLLLIRGEAGVGKTRLVAELAGHVRQRGARVATAACFEHERVLPTSPLADLLRATIALVGADALEQLSAWQIADLARLVPELETQLPSGGTPPTEGGQLRLFHVLSSLMIALARQNPLMLVLEDLHWAHASTLAWVHHLSRNLTDAPLLLVITYRPEDGALEAKVNSLVRQLEQKSTGAELALSRLTREELDRWMVGASAAVVESIYRHTEGNPLFVLETQRALLEAGQLSIEDGCWVTRSPLRDLPVPDSIRQAVTMRLDRLTAEARRALEVAAVIGRAFDFDILQETWGRDEEITLEALDELLRHQLVREAEGFFDQDYELTHHLLRSIVADSLSEHHRRRLHHRVATALVTLRTDDQTRSAEVAYHYVEAGDWARAQEHLFKAGEQAARVAADTEALDYYRRAMEAYESAVGDGRAPSRDPLPRAILEHRMGECFFRRGDYDQAQGHLKHALSHLGRPLPTSPGKLHWGVGRAVLRQLIHRILPARLLQQRTARDPIVEEEVDIYTFIGWVYALLADYESYLLVVLRALNVSERTQFARGEAVSAAAVGTGLDFMSLFKLARIYHRRAQARAQQVEDTGTRGFISQSLAYHSYLRGDEEATLQHAQQSADAYRKAGDAHRWAVATLLMVYVYEHRGDLTRAWEHACDLSRTGHELADRRTLCAGEEAMGIIRRHQGQVSEAITHLQRAAALAEEIPDRMMLVEIMGELGKCYLRQREWQAAVETLETARNTAREYGVEGDSLGRLLNSLAEATLSAAEQETGLARAAWLQQARIACRAALAQSRAYRPGRPEAMRLYGTCAWLCDKPTRARRWWRRSQELAAAMGHRYDRALTDLEIGTRLGSQTLLQQAEAQLADIGAAWHLTQARALLNTPEAAGTLGSQ